MGRIELLNEDGIEGGQNFGEKGAARVHQELVDQPSGIQLNGGDFLGGRKVQNEIDDGVRMGRSGKSGGTARETVNRRAIGLLLRIPTCEMLGKSTQTRGVCVRRRGGR
jgi:hypothetical protein